VPRKPPEIASSAVIAHAESSPTYNRENRNVRDYASDAACLTLWILTTSYHHASPLSKLRLPCLHH